MQIPFGGDGQQEQGKSFTQAKPSSLPHKQHFHWAFCMEQLLEQTHGATALFPCDGGEQYQT